MTLMSILAEARGGDYFASAAKACGMTASDAKSALDRLCPAIAVHLKSKAQSDNDAFEALLDLLDDGVDGNGLDALTDAEAISDGKVVLEDLYGSPSAALAEMMRLPCLLPVLTVLHRRAAEFWAQLFRLSSRGRCRVLHASLLQNAGGGGAASAHGGAKRRGADGGQERHRLKIFLDRFSEPANSHWRQTWTLQKSAASSA